MKYAVLTSVIFKVLKDFLPISTHKSKKTNHKVLLIALTHTPHTQKEKPIAQISFPQRVRTDFETVIVDWQIHLNLKRNIPGHMLEQIFYVYISDM